MNRIILVLAVFFLCANLYPDTVILKDDQVFEADVVSFDAYYLIVKMQNNQEVSIPWKEVRQIKHTTTQKNWMEDVYKTSEETEVETLISPLSSNTALQRAFFPGFLIHGSGHFYAKDQKTGFTLLSMEIVSIFLMAVSLSEIISPVQKDQSFNLSNIVFYSGLAVFGGTWLYDLVFSSGATDEYNRKNQDKFIIKESEK